MYAAMRISGRLQVLQIRATRIKRQIVLDDNKGGKRNDSSVQVRFFGKQPANHTDCDGKQRHGSEKDH
jgi:hypothetical protein